MDHAQYEIKTSSKARHVRITIYPDGRVVITKPARVSEALARDFAHRKSVWIQKKLDVYQNRKIVSLPKLSLNKTEALKLVRSRVEFLNQPYGFVIGRITLKNHKSLWGSCSRRGNLNFNIKILQLPESQMDYIIVHELCHLAEFNHSKSFWTLVSRTVPNYKHIKQELRNYSFY